jgi:allophanate hydrolase subunit 2
VLGSRSYDVLAALGPLPVQAGDILPIGPAPKAWPHVDVGPPARPSARIALLAGSLGPHVDALEPDAQAALTEWTWTVSWDSDRSGLRLDGAELSRVPGVEWPPEGVVRGAVQVPPSGRPVLMLADHPVTGGYPAVAALADASCDLAAQLRPGDRLRLALRSAVR